MLFYENLIHIVLISLLVIIVVWITFCSIETSFETSFEKYWNDFLKIIPKSEIPRKEFGGYCIEIPKGRVFNFIGDPLRNRINEVFSYSVKKIEWGDNGYKSDKQLFKDFDCVFYKKLPSKTFEPLTLFYFADNDIKWDSNQYLYDKINNKYYYPESNSMLMLDEELEWIGDPEINVIIGKQSTNKILLYT